MPKEKTVKEKKEKVLTRAQAEKALTAGADPENFTKHPNYHVRYKAWRKQGSPLPENAEERSKFLATLHVKVKLSLGDGPVLLPTGEDGMVDI